MNYLLDTCVISELVAKRPDPKVVAWVDGVNDESLYLSAITVGEIARGIERLPESRRKETLNAWLKEELLPRFSGRILDANVEVMLDWGTLVAQLEQAGRSLPAMDSLIAATALYNGCCLVTRNVDDFSGANVTVINPWS